jgi:hypothetical protein
MSRFSTAIPVGLLTLTLLTGCADSTRVLTGHARPAIDPQSVVVYSEPPPHFEEVAVINASSHSAFGPGGRRGMDKVIERLKDQAAEVGANGIIVEGFSDRETGSLGSGGESDSASHNSAVGVGVSGSVGLFKKTGRARAIYVAPRAAESK